MSKEVWSRSFFKFNVHEDNTEKLDAAFQVVADLAHVSKDQSALDGTKSRIVVNGADQKHEDYNIHSEISASTGRRSNLFSIAAFATANNWAHATKTY